MSIRGPRSALSKFLEEENIKVDGKKAIKDKKKIVMIGLWWG